MQLLKPLLIAAAALAVTQAHAVSDYSFSFTAVPTGVYVAPTFSDGVKASVQTTSLTHVYMSPKGITGEYLVVSNLGGGVDGSATIQVGDATSFSFVWGSPDTYNWIEIYGAGGTEITYTGFDLQSQFGKQANGNNDETGLFTITANGASVIDHVVFKSSGVAFEIAAPVPEPSTYALMLASLGALGVIARRGQRTSRAR